MGLEGSLDVAYMLGRLCIGWNTAVLHLFESVHSTSHSRTALTSTLWEMVETKSTNSSKLADIKDAISIQSVTQRSRTTRPRRFYHPNSQPSSTSYLLRPPHSISSQTRSVLFAML